MATRRKSKRRIDPAGRVELAATPPAAPPGDWRWPLAIALALIVLNLIVYAPLRHYDFVSWDDPDYVTRNQYVLQGLTWDNVAWALTTGHSPYWHPLTWLSHMLDVTLFGVHPGGAHITSVILHTANSVILFGLLLQMTNAPGRSAFVAALFAVHPLHVESVAWIAERKDVLSTLFMLLAIWAYAVYARHRRPRHYVAVFGFFALALMAKPMVVTLPFALLLLDVWPLGRREPLRARVIEKLPLFVLAVFVSVTTFLVQQRVGAVGGFDILPISVRLSNAAVAYVAYVGQMFWPVRLAAFYPYRLEIPGWEVAASALMLIGMSAVVLRAAPRRPFLLVGWLWYLGMLVPAIGLIQAGNQAHADRFVYVPLIGVLWILAWGVPDLLARWPSWRRVPVAAGGIAIALCAMTARVQVKSWANSEALWRHALEVTTDNYQAHDALGLELGGHGKTAEALEHFREALRIKPDFANAHHDFGFELAREGRLNEAIAEYTEALRLNPNLAGAYDNLGVALARQGKTSEAVAQYAEAVRLDPTFASAHSNLGLALANQGDVTSAIAQYQEALRLDPGLADAHLNLGNALGAQGQFDDAIDHFREVLRLEPRSAAAHDNWGHALAGQGKHDEAIAQYAEALRLDPTLADAHINMGVALASQGRIKDAMPYFSEAVRLKPDLEIARLNLARALAASGQMEDAIRQLREALRLNPASAPARAMLDELLKKTPAASR